VRNKTLGKKKQKRNDEIIHESDKGLLLRLEKQRDVHFENIMNIVKKKKNAENLPSPRGAQQ
jgi:hypothetical protein